MSYSSSKMDSRPWADIPQELLEAITSRMPSIDQIRCSTVCKTWNRILKEIGLAFGSLPWMMFYGRISSNSAIICELYEPMYRKTYPVHLENLFYGYSSNAKKLGFGAHGYKNGWMVFGFGSQLAIYNLFTHEVVKLPNMDGYWFDDRLQVTFSSSNPKSSDCLFLALHSHPGFLDEPDFLEEQDFFYEAGYTISMCRSGDKAWKTKPHVTFGLGVCRSIIQLEGKKNLFCLSDYGSLGVFDVATETWYLIKDLKSGGERLFGHSSTSMLVECDGELLCIYDAKGGDNHNSWKVARFDFWEIDWVKEEGSCFRDRALFFHFNSWFWIPAGKGGGEARELANTVNYYDANGQYYSYKTGTRENILPHLHSHSQLFTNISEDEVRLKKAWIIPPRL